METKNNKIPRIYDINGNYTAEYMEWAKKQKDISKIAPTLRRELYY